MFDGENISFDASLVIHINGTNISPIMIINRIYETQKSSVAVACVLPGRAKDLSAPLYIRRCRVHMKVIVVLSRYLPIYIKTTSLCNPTCCLVLTVLGRLTRNVLLLDSQVVIDLLMFP